MGFEYLEPLTVEEAVSALVTYDGRAKVIAGGTDLIIQMRQKTIRPDYIIDITNIPGLDYISYDDKQGLRIGALTTIRSIEKSTEIGQVCPAILHAASHLGTVGVRNLATIGGNLCNAAPSAEMAPALIGLSGRAKIVGPNGERVVSIEDFFTGPGTTLLRKGELLIEIQIPNSLPGTKSIYLKHAIRKRIDLAIVGVAAVIVFEPPTYGMCKEVRIVLGAVAPTPMRALNAEAILRGGRMNDGLIDESAEAASAEARPITDVRASAWYRKEMVKIFTRQALKKLMAHTG